MGKVRKSFEIVPALCLSQTFHTLGNRFFSYCEGGAGMAVKWR